MPAAGRCATWKKPSSQQLAPKLGYVVAVPEWGWMLGTGIYLDDVEETLRQLDARAETDIRETMAWIGVIAAISILLVAAGGLALNISEHREADAKLRQLAQRVVQSQEEERARLSRDLHDGVSQLLVSVKLLLETAANRLRRPRASRGGGAGARHHAGAAGRRLQRGAPGLAQPAPRPARRPRPAGRAAPPAREMADESGRPSTWRWKARRARWPTSRPPRCSASRKRR